MPRRLTIGLRYKHRDAWVGGVYYVRNLVLALKRLPRGLRPRLVVIGEDLQALEDLGEATGYEDLRLVSKTRVQRAPARPSALWGAGRGDEIDLILLDTPPGFEDRGILWIPDFQEHRHPEFFAATELDERLERNRTRLGRHRHVMVSSQDVAADLDRYYGTMGNRVHVVRFACSEPSGPAAEDAAALRAKYDLPDRYFICSNQFWKHKNHDVVLRALADINADEPLPPMVFTGREEDNRDPAFGPSIKARAKALGLDHRVRFLGFVPRQDQLGLIKASIAVIQPSLCEGWSTVAEDAKAAGRHVMASDIPVHREQLVRYADFFAPHGHEALARLLRTYEDIDPIVVPVNYEAARRRFTRDLWRMITNVERDLRRRRIDRLLIAPGA